MRVNEKILEELAELRRELSRLRQLVNPPLRGLLSEKDAAQYLDISVKVLREGVTSNGRREPLPIQARYVGFRKMYALEDLDGLIGKLPRVHPRHRDK